MKSIWIAMLLIGLNATAAKPPAKPSKAAGLPLKKLIDASTVIYLARCPHPAQGCKNAKGDALEFIQVRTLKGAIEPFHGQIVVELVNSKNQADKKKRPVLSQAYAPTIPLEQAGRTDVILFLNEAGKGRFRFTAPSGYESGTLLSQINAALIKSSK